MAGAGVGCPTVGFRTQLSGHRCRSHLLGARFRPITGLPITHLRSLIGLQGTDFSCRYAANSCDALFSSSDIHRRPLSGRGENIYGHRTISGDRRSPGDDGAMYFSTVALQCGTGVQAAPRSDHGSREHEDTDLFCGLLAHRACWQPLLALPVRSSEAQGCL